MRRAPVVFASTNVAAASTPQTARITNTDLAPLTITAATVQGRNAADFTIGANTCTTADVAPGATCTMRVTFRPQAPGDRVAGISVSDDAGGPHTIAPNLSPTQPVAGNGLGGALCT